MNLNYVGSVAERFMKFRSALASTEEIDENLFNALSIYIPKSLATAQFESGAYDGSEVTADKFAVITVTVDNYADVLKNTGALYAQWLPIFNDGTNLAVTLYCIVFDDTTFSPTPGAGAISWSPLTKAFKELYFISYLKFMFSEHYDGNKVAHEPAEAGDYDDSNYFDLCLCLSALCEGEATLSFFMCEAHLEVFEEGSADTNVCKVMSQSIGDETTHCTTFVDSTTADRAQYFWGYLNLIGGNRTFFTIHNGSVMLPIVLASWFEDQNDTGEYVGNKLAKIRLQGSKVKPTGLPSELNSDVNKNLGSYIYDILDTKCVAYFIAIDGTTLNNAEMIRDRNIQNFPLTAMMIAKWIDYNTAQDVAHWRDARSTLTDPVLCNEEAYAEIQAMLVKRVQAFSGIGRITNIVLDFPPFSEAKKGTNLEGTMVWKATYTDDLGSVTMTGSVEF